jgi:hypothetical protein
VVTGDIRTSLISTVSRWAVNVPIQGWYAGRKCGSAWWGRCGAAARHCPASISSHSTASQHFLTSFPKAQAPTMKEAALYMHHAEKDPQEAKKIAHDTANRECYPVQW